MRSKYVPSRFRAGITAVMLALASPRMASAAPSPVMLDNCIKPVDATPVTGSAALHKAFISRSTLRASEAAASMPFEMALKMRNVAEMKARIDRGEHISPQELAAKYEPLPADYHTVVDWLTSQGFTVTRQDPHHLAVFARGSVSRVAQAMQVKFARVTYRGKEFTSAITAPSVPQAISPLLVGINGLQPHLRPHKHIVRPADSGGGATYTPAQIAQAYHVTGLSNANVTGAGQSIAIVIDTYPAAADLISFWDSYGISQSMNNITLIPVEPEAVGTLPVLPSSDDEDPGSEVTLDTEWSSAMAPAAKVRIYATTALEYSYLDTAYSDVLEDATNHPNLGIHQMSMSYGAGEIDDISTSQRQTDDVYFMELVNAGVTCFAASGDEGPTPDILTGDDKIQVEAPASDTYVIGVGGTSLTNASSPSSSTEVVWNDGASGGATGGGASVIASGTVQPYLSRPSWQAVVTSGNQRLVPDIACAADPNYGADYYYTEPAGGQHPDIPTGEVESVIGGTSWATPTCAGFCALINQARANVGLSAVGQLAPQLYALIGTANFTSNFREITTGNNSTATGNGFSANANGSYNEATGIGVPLVTTLAETLANTSTLVGVGQASNLVTVTLGQNATITAMASGSPLGYQWEIMPTGGTTWSPVTDNAVFSGSTSATLTITNTTAAMSGDQFECAVAYAGTTVASAQPTALIVENPWNISTLAGDVGTSGTTNATGTGAEFDYPTGVVLDASGNLYIADLDNNQIREVASGQSSTPYEVSTPYGSLSGPTGYGYANGTGNNAIFNAPRDIAIDHATGYLYVSDEGNNLIRKIVPSASTVSTFAGTVPVVADSTSQLFYPRGICVDSSSNVYVADSGHNVIRKITSSGVISTFAGSTSFTAGYADGTGTAAMFNQPIGMAIDGSNNLYVADFGNCCVRKITPAGVVSTLAGQAGVAGSLDGTGSQALFNVPRGITVDSSGNVYVTDSAPPAVVQNAPAFSANNLLREISPSNVVTTLAGQAGVAGTANGLGSAAQFYTPCGLTVDANGLLYIADAGNNAIRLAGPSVALSTTVPFASAVVPQAGQFTVSRTGSTLAGVTLSYSTQGSTAIGGSDYNATDLPGTVTIPAGASSATIAVNPLANPQATGNRTLQLTLTSAISGLTTDPSSATVTLIEAPAETFATWQANNPDPATPLGDGIPDVAKYAFDIDPTVPMTSADRAALPSSGEATSGTTTYLTLTYRENAGLSGATTVTPEVSSDLTNWTTLSTTPTVIGFDATTQDPILQVQVPVTSGDKEFLRLYINP